MIVGLKQDKIIIELSAQEAINIKQALAKTHAKGRVLDTSMELEEKLYKAYTNPIKPNPMKKILTAILIAFSVIIINLVTIDVVLKERIKETKKQRLDNCLRYTERTDFECDSCYHKIYGPENKDCGLCE
jgi:multisubunit Na+/H+ antiporter MnhC subunit